MKILMLSWEFPPLVAGGLGRHVAELAPALTQYGVEVHVVVPCTNPPVSRQPLSPQLTIHWVNTSTITNDADIYTRACQVNELLDDFASQLWHEEGPFDLIHAHDWLVAFAAIELKLAKKCPLIATIHATERGRWRSQFLPTDLARKIDSVERNLTFEAWRVIACSYYMIDELIRLFALPLNKMDMIPNGVNLAGVRRFPLHTLLQFRADYVSSGQPLIFSVGRLVYEKGYQVVVKAMPQILSQFPQTKFILAGKGPFSADLQLLAKEMGIGEYVKLIGFTKDEQRDMLFSVASCAVFPSLYEPFGIVALEAMAFNCPVVVSNVGGLAEVVKHNETGALIYPDNPDSAAWGILQTLYDPEAAANYATNAHRMVVQKYNWQIIAGQTFHIYQRIITERANTKW